MGNHIFVCYARADQEFTLKLANNLKKQGLPIWLDQWNITPGEDWDTAIEDALDKCSAFVIILSPNAVRSREVRAELRTALDDHKTILPVLYQDCRIPRQLRITEYVDFRGLSPGDKNALQRVLSSLKTKASPPPSKAVQPIKAQSTPVQTTKTPSVSDLLSASRSTKTQDFLQPYRTTGGARPLLPAAATRPPTTTVKREPEPEFYQRWTWWVSFAAVVLLGSGGAILADWLLDLVMGLDMFVAPGKWWAIIAAGMLFGVTYVALCIDGYESWDDYVLPMILWSTGSSFVGWGLAAGATFLAARFVTINPALAGYLVFGAVILFVAGLLVKEEGWEDRGRWLMAPLVILLSIATVFLVDYLIGLGLNALNISVPEMPSKWLAFLLTGVVYGVAFLGTDSHYSGMADIVLGVVGLSVSFGISWGMALGAAYLTDRYLSISFAIVGYIVYGLAILYGIRMTRAWISEM